MTQSAFDALSAACGVGILSSSAQYTPRGRWILTAIGVAGAALYLAVALVAMRRFMSFAFIRSLDDTPDECADTPNDGFGDDARLAQSSKIESNTALSSALRDFPQVRTVLIAYLALCLCSGFIFFLVAKFSDSSIPAREAARVGVTLASSSGLTFAETVPGPAWLIATLSVIVALGWPVWLLASRASKRRSVSAVWKTTASFFVFLLVIALLITILETPIESRASSRENPQLSGQPFTARFVRATTQTCAAVGAGVPSESLDDRAVAAGTQFLLACTTFVGGFPGSPAGGVKWSILLLVVLAALRRRDPANTPESRQIIRYAATRLVVSLFLLTLVVTLGILVIHRLTASPYESPPRFTAALLDASSCVNGANLTAGPAARIIDPNLSGGIGQPVDQYGYGVAWLMLAMLAGRVIPIWVLESSAKAAKTPPPASNSLIL
ncbi:MAG: hypothetical protein AB7N71_12125 [Phycisphaerae bacterium]